MPDRRRAGAAGDYRGGRSEKTRLAAEMCVRIAGQGWQAGFADPKAPGGRAQLEFDRPTLLVIDDADLNVALLADLLRTAGNWAPGTPPVRLLLLARHSTGWWDTLNQRTDHPAGELADPPLMLHDGELDPADRTEHHARALTAVAARLPDAGGPAGQATPPLADPAFTSPLLVHMHALLTVCGAQIPTTGTAVRERILDAVLDRERDRWAATFPADVPTGGARTRQQAVTDATLLAPPTDIATAQAMTVINEFAAEAAAGARAAVATWLHELYPRQRPYLGRADAPGPAGRATARQLPAASRPGPGRLREHRHAGTGRADTGRAHPRRCPRPVREALSQLLDIHLPDLLTAAVDGPTSRLPDLLDLTLTRSPRPAAAATLADRLPERSTGLTALAVTLSSQAVGHHRQEAAARPDAFTPDLATSLDNLSVRLAGLGRPEDALAAIQEALTLRRQLPAARPDAFTPDLAGSLMTYGVRLTELSRHRDALAADREALALYRRLHAAHPDAFRNDLVNALRNLVIDLRDLSMDDEAEQVGRELTTLAGKPQ